MPISRSLAEMEATLRDLLLGVDLLNELFHRIDRHGHGALDAALDRKRVRTGRHVAETFADDGLRQHRRGGRAVAGDVVGLGSHFLHELRAHVLEVVGELDLFRDRHAVVGDRRRTELLIEHDVAAFGAERDAHGVREDVCTALERATRGLVEDEFFSSH